MTAAIKHKRPAPRRMPRITRGDDRIIAAILISVAGIATLFPVFWMFRTSLMTNMEINSYPPRLLPKNWRFDNYPEALASFPFGQYLVNTLLIALPSILGAVLTSTLAAYAFARLRFPLRGFWFSLVVTSMLMPGAVTVIPIFIMWSALGFGNSFVPLIVPAFLGGGAFNIFLVRQFMMTIPKDLDEAAIIDGAGHMQILFGILIHLVKPVLISVGLFVFIAYWNDLLGPVIYISNPERYTISQGLSTFTGHIYTNWKSLMAASCMSVAPAIALYIFGQKYFIEGIVLTGMKS